MVKAHGLQYIQTPNNACFYLDLQEVVRAVVDDKDAETVIGKDLMSDS